jgi:hypothetical protein
MRLLRTLTLALLLPFTTLANSANFSERQFFIESYASLSVEEMGRTGIPASITLAQAILESNWGQGSVAREGNNFFCIKCHNGWSGPFIEAPDDETGLSCFRSYSSVEESFFDHSEFLLANSRYRKLFQYSATDYRSWAKGLQDCGYATDSLYSIKLIALIEDHGLFLYDYAIPAHRVKVMNTAYEAGSEQEIVPPAPAFHIDAVTEPANGDSQEPVMDVPVYKLNNSPAAEGETSISSLVSAANSSPAEADHPKEIIKPLLPVPSHQLGRR